LFELATDGGSCLGDHLGIRRERLRLVAHASDLSQETVQRDWHDRLTAVEHDLRSRDH
jgi:hypothetical protein